MPVWADAYGDEIQKSNWLTYLLISNPLGVVLGYGLCAGFQETIGWRWAFYIQAICLGPCLLSIICVPLRYLNIKQMNKEVQKLNSADSKGEAPEQLFAIREESSCSGPDGEHSDNKEVQLSV